MSANERQVGGEHYKQHGETGEQHWDRVDRTGMDYFQGNITKYVERCWDKNGIQDLEKARHYLDKYIEIHKARGTLPKAQRPTTIVRGPLCTNCNHLASFMLDDLPYCHEHADLRKKYDEKMKPEVKTRTLADSGEVVRVCDHEGCTNWTNLTTVGDKMLCDFHVPTEFSTQGEEGVLSETTFDSPSRMADSAPNYAAPDGATRNGIADVKCILCGAAAGSEHLSGCERAYNAPLVVSTAPARPPSA